jgi:hypothetical protein
MTERKHCLALAEPLLLIVRHAFPEHPFERSGVASPLAWTRRDDAAKAKDQRVEGISELECGLDLRPRGELRPAIAHICKREIEILAHARRLPPMHHAPSYQMEPKPGDWLREGAQEVTSHRRVVLGQGASDASAAVAKRRKDCRRSGGFRLSAGLPAPEHADEPACLGAVERDGRGLVVLEGAEPDERGRFRRAYLRAVLVGIDDERRAELRGERCERAARLLRALLERSRVVAEEEVDLTAVGEPFEGGPLARGRPVPVATGPRRPITICAAVGETTQAAEPEASSRRQVVQAEAERHWARRGPAGAGAGERFGVVMISFYEQKLEPRAAEQVAGAAEEAAPFRVARQVEEVAERDEGVAVFLDGALDQAAQVAALAVQVAEHKQTAHSRRAYRCAFSRSGGGAADNALACDRWQHVS